VNKLKFIVLLAACVMAQNAIARQERSEAAKNDFKKTHPCPSNGHHSGSCPGYVIDHIKPLACGGLDAPINMQWQTVAEGKAKDKWERKGCEVGHDTHSQPSSSYAATGVYITGPKGGCYTVTSGGQKHYVDHAYCGRN
jgi:hypothetical protein